MRKSHQSETVTLQEQKVSCHSTMANEVTHFSLYYQEYLSYPSVTQTITTPRSVEDQQDIDSNIVTLHRVELIRSVHNLQSKTLIPAYIRIEAFNIHNLHIPPEIVDYIILYIYYKPPWEMEKARRDLMELFDRINQQTVEELDALFNGDGPIKSHNSKGCACVVL